MTTTLNYTQKREALFGLKSKTDTISVSAPVARCDDYKRYHVYVVCDEKEHKVHTSFTLEEAKALIQYEREENDNPANSSTYGAMWGDYGNQFNWIVKDTKEYTTHFYNPTSRSLELNMR